MISTFYHHPFPTLQLDDQYYLREQRLDDAEDFFAYYANPNVCQHILASTPTCVLEARSEIAHCQKLFYDRRGAYWAIATRDTDKMIGAIGLYINNQHHRAEISYELSEAYWRKGIMSKAIACLAGYCFLELDVRRIEALVLDSNQPSIALLHKHGFTREGTLRAYRYFQNKSRDVELYALTYAEFMAQIPEHACDKETA